MKYFWNGIKGFFHITDRWLLIMWLSASMVSLLFLWGVYHSGLSYESKIYSQLGAIGIGLVAALIIAQFNYLTLVKLWKLYMPVCVILVVLTFFYGTVRGGDQAWLTFQLAGYNFSLQPSEFLKISFITTFSLHLSKVEGNLNSLFNVALLCLHGGAHILLIQLQGDTGTALIFVMIFVIMIFCAGLNWRYLLSAAVATAAFLPVLWFRIMTEDQKMRILTVYNPEISERYAYQQTRSVMAIGMGGVQGTGIFAGGHIQVPEIYNDFIFAFIGESSGFVGSMGVILLLTSIALKIFYNAGKAKDPLGRYICIGVFAMIISQMIINLGMCLSLLPVIGVTLPLMSSGGSSVLSLYLGLGFVLSIYGHSRTGLFSSEN